MIYVDSSIVMRLVEGIESVRTPIEERLRQLSESERVLVTSRLACLECRRKPLREKQAALLDLYRGFFSSKELTVCEITAAVVDRATIIRAETNFKTPDAIHAWTAILAGAVEFWTTDADFQRCSDLTLRLFTAV
jgi:predicted nucleic acid-binding protein